MNAEIMRHHQTFETLKQMQENGAEFWFARELQAVLDYSRWEKFEQVIKKAMIACKKSGQPIDDHFPQVVKMVQIGSSAQRKTRGYRLSRYACYLVVQNGDPTKPVIANGQTYFAIQTRRKELEMGSTELAANLFRATQTEEKLKRDEIRGKTNANKTHYEVGTKVRKTLTELGGAMPEDLPAPNKGIKQLKTGQKKLESDE